MKNIYPATERKYPKPSVKDEGTQALDNAYSIILSTFEDYIKEHDVTNEDINYVKNTIDKVYYELKGINLLKSILLAQTEEMLSNWAKYSSLYDIQEFSQMKKAKEKYERY